MTERNCCHLCGEKLVNGYCRSCGFYAVKNKKVRYHLNESGVSHRLDASGDSVCHKPKTDKKKSGAQRFTADFGKWSKDTKKPQALSRKSGSQNAGNKVNKKRFATILGIAGVVISLLVALAGIMEENTYSQSIPEYESEEYNPYEYVARELSETGEYFVTELSAGEYLVGVHLPEGNYTVRFLEGAGGLSVSDYENIIYLYESFGEDPEYGGVLRMEDVRLYDGALVEVNSNVRLEFETQNGQNQSMRQTENPLKEAYRLKRGEQYTVGDEIEPGVYDICEMFDSSIFYFDYPTYEGLSGTEEFVSDTLWLEPDDEGTAYRNLVLLKGMSVMMEETDFVLMPSAQIGSVDYESYYDFR